MEKFPIEKEKFSPFEVKIGIEADEENLKGSLRSAIRFIVDKNFNIWISHTYHESIRASNGIDEKDQIAEGFFLSKGK